MPYVSFCLSIINKLSSAPHSFLCQPIMQYSFCCLPNLLMFIQMLCIYHLLISVYEETNFQHSLLYMTTNPIEQLKCCVYNSVVENHLFLSAYQLSKNFHLHQTPLFDYQLNNADENCLSSYYFGYFDYFG